MYKWRSTDFTSNRNSCLRLPVSHDVLVPRQISSFHKSVIFHALVVERSRHRRAHTRHTTLLESFCWILLDTFSGVFGFRCSPEKTLVHSEMAEWSGLRPKPHTSVLNSMPQKNSTLRLVASGISGVLISMYSLVLKYAVWDAARVSFLLAAGGTRFNPELGMSSRRKLKYLPTSCMRALCRGFK